MKRRRPLVTYALLLCITAFLAWLLWRPRDPRLVGTWIVTPDPQSNWNEAWQLRRDGTGERDLRRTRSEGDTTHIETLAERFRWWTDADCLYIKGGTDAVGWDRITETAEELIRAVEGQPERFETREYEFVVSKEKVIRVEPEQPTPADDGTLIFSQPGSIEFGLD